MTRPPERVRSVHPTIVYILHTEALKPMSVSASPNVYTDISPMEVRDMLAAGATAIDVREPDEYANGHICGARLIPLGTLCDNLDSLPKEGALIFICRSGRRSVTACAEIGCLEGRALYNMVGGMLAWERVGLPMCY